MQLTNISRDVIEDKKRNRSYINHDFNSIKETIELANTFYESSFPAIKSVPLSLCQQLLLEEFIEKLRQYTHKKHRKL